MAADVYVVLVNYNGWRNTIECLESVLHSDHRAVRVVVCDNGSTDDSLERIHAWAQGALSVDTSTSNPLRHLTKTIVKPLRLEHRTRDELETGSDIDWSNARIVIVECGANLGFAAANNVAMRYVLRRDPTADVLLLNNDTVIAPDAISAMARTAHEEERGSAVGATVLQYHDPDTVETLAGATVGSWHGMTRLIAGGTSRTARSHGQPPMDFISGCCILLPAEALKDVGLLDERFFIYCEDADWGIRLREAGVALKHASRAEVWHKGGATSVHRSEFHDYHNVKSVLLLVQKHRPGMLPFAMAYLSLRFLAPKLVRGQWRRLRAALRGYRDFLSESSRSVRVARKVSAKHDARLA